MMIDSGTVTSRSGSPRDEDCKKNAYRKISFYRLATHLLQADHCGRFIKKEAQAAAAEGVSMEALIDFSNLMNGMQYMPDRDKIILVALINAHTPENGDSAKIERLIGQIVIAAARDKKRNASDSSTQDLVVTPISNARA
jgi:hypothetical protein